MKPPIITAAYTAVLALIYVWLSFQVVRLRWGNRMAFGDGGNTELRSAIRAHAHFGENVPMIVLMAAFLEATGASAMAMHVLMGALLIARVLHPLGMYAKPGTLQIRIGRVGGMTMTVLVMVACAVAILARVAAGQP